MEVGRMNDFIDLTRREQVQGRVVDAGTDVATSTGVQHAVNIGVEVRVRRAIKQVDDDGEVSYEFPEDDGAGWFVELYDADRFMAEFEEPDDFVEENDADTYEDGTVKDLKAEIDRRNADRDPSGDNYITPEPPGNKPELIAALEADDATGTPG